LIIQCSYKAYGRKKKDKCVCDVVENIVEVCAEEEGMLMYMGFDRDEAVQMCVHRHVLVNR
jgi:hypothetical protein